MVNKKQLIETFYFTGLLGHCMVSKLLHNIRCSFFFFFLSIFVLLVSINQINSWFFLFVWHFYSVTTSGWSIRRRKTRDRGRRKKTPRVHLFRQANEHWLLIHDILWICVLIVLVRALRTVWQANSDCL